MKLATKKFCIYEIEAVNIDRFFGFFLQLDEPPDLILVGHRPEYDKYCSKGRFKDGKVVCSAWMRIGDLAELFRQNRIEVLVVCAHRIPDIHVILAARLAGCHVAYLQHGMYIPFMKRTIPFFLSNVVKTFKYLCYAVDIAAHKGKPKLALDLFRIHVIGSRRNLVAGQRDLFPDECAMFSNYWGRWHETHYAFPHEGWFSMGTPDFRRYAFGPPLDSAHIAYCYQTLVEDGRISWEEMERFYARLLSWASDRGKTIVVKSHPRASLENLAWFTDRGIQIVSDHVPNTEMVIGHYSSLLAFWGVHGKAVVCVRLPGHPIDPSIASWSNVVDQLEEIPAGLTIDVDGCKEKFGECMRIEELYVRLGLLTPKSTPMYPKELAHVH